MTTEDLIVGFDARRQAHYEEEIATRYGDAELNESRQRWGNYAPEERARIQREGDAIYRELATYIGQDPATPAVQAIVAR